MKPRIRKHYGIWICWALLVNHRDVIRVAGHGYTPAEAYAEWELMWKTSL